MKKNITININEIATYVGIASIAIFSYKYPIIGKVICAASSICLASSAIKDLKELIESSEYDDDDAAVAAKAANILPDESEEKAALIKMCSEKNCQTFTDKIREAFDASNSNWYRSEDDKCCGPEVNRAAHDENEIKATKLKKALFTPIDPKYNKDTEDDVWCNE